MNNLYIFTLTWNNCDALTKLKNSLIPSLNGLSFNWLIKDNASKDNTIIEASSWGNNVKVFPYKNNLQNFSEGMNYLLAQSSPNDEDYILLLNNDVIFNDNKSIKNMIDIMEKDDNVGVVGCRLLYTGTNKLQHAGVIFDPKMKMPLHFRCNEKTDSSAEKNRLFQVVTGAVLLTKAKYFKNVCDNKSGNKGLCERLIWAFDDVDLCLSIYYNMNKKIVYCGNTNIFHEESASLKKNPANKLFMTHNVDHLLNKWGKRIALDKDFYYKDQNYNLYIRNS